MTQVLCNHKGCLHWHPLEKPENLPGKIPQDWDEGFSGECLKEVIGIKVREIHSKDFHYAVPECQSYARRHDWRIHLPYPDDIAKRGGRILGSQEHDSSR